jgi:hypothetical protein
MRIQPKNLLNPCEPEIDRYFESARANWSQNGVKAETTSLFYGKKVKNKGKSDSKVESKVTPTQTPESPRENGVESEKKIIYNRA